MGFSRQEYWSGLPLPSPYQHGGPIPTTQHLAGAEHILTSLNQVYSIQVETSPTKVYHLYLKQFQLPFIIVFAALFLTTEKQFSVVMFLTQTAKIKSPEIASFKEKKETISAQWA